MVDKLDYIGLELTDSNGLTWNDVVLDKTEKEIIIKDKVVINYRDLIDNHFTLNMESKNKLLIGNISENVVDGVLWLDPDVTLTASDIMADVESDDSINGNHQSQIKWNISSIPSEQNINDATLVIYVSSADNPPDNDVRFWRVDDQTWVEGISTSNYDSQTIDNLTSTVYNVTPSLDIWISFNISSVIQADLDDGNDNSTVRFEDPDNPHDGGSVYVNDYEDNGVGRVGSAYYTFSSSEAVSNEPHLIITYSPKDSGPPTYSLNQTNTTIAGVPTLFSLNWTDDQTLDSYIFSFYNGSNYTLCQGNLVCNLLTEAQCNNCSQCDWSYSEDVSDTDDLSSSTDWATWGSSGRGIAYNQGDSTNCYNDDNDDCMEFDGCDGKTIEKQSDIDMSGCIDGTGWVYMYMEEGGAMESDDCVNILFSDDSGSTWGDSAVVKCDDFSDGTTANISIPDAYLVSGFRYQFDCEGFIGSDEEYFFDNFQVGCTGGNICENNGTCGGCGNITSDLCDNCSDAGCSWNSLDLKNDTAVAFDGGTWSNVTKTVNSTTGATIKWCYYANDTSNNWNGSSCVSPFSYLTTTADTCTYTSGNWAVDCSDDCEISSNVDVGGNNITIIGTGTFTMTANVTNYEKITIKGTEWRVL